MSVQRQESVWGQVWRYSGLSVGTVSEVIVNRMASIDGELEQYPARNSV